MPWDLLELDVNVLYLPCQALAHWLEHLCVLKMREVPPLKPPQLYQIHNWPWPNTEIRFQGISPPVSALQEPQGKAWSPALAWEQGQPPGRQWRHRLCCGRRRAGRSCSARRWCSRCLQTDGTGAPGCSDSEQEDYARDYANLYLTRISPRFLK